MPLKTFQDETPSLNLTPMIDVVFQLVLFLVVGTQFADMERDQEVKVPQVRDNGTLTKTEAPQQKVVNVRRDGAITLNDRPISLADLQAELKAAHAQYREIGVVVRGDGAGAWQNVATVLNAVRLAGVTNIFTSVRLDDKSH